MNTKNKPKTTGALAPQKETLFSINVTEKGAQIRLVSNAPPQQIRQEVVRNRVRVD
jgi:hypothetical protein